MTPGQPDSHGLGLQRYAEQDATDLPRLVVPATVAAAAIVSAGVIAGYAVFVAVLALLGLVLAWGWPGLLDAPSRTGVQTVLAIGVLLQVATLALAGRPDQLRWLPVAVAIGLIGAFVQQITRADGRSRMTTGVAAAGSGLAVVASGATLAPLSGRPVGPALVLVAMSAVVAAAVVSRVERVPRLRTLAVVLVLVVGAVTAWTVAVLVGVNVLTAVGLGMFAASLSYSLRHVLGALPDREPVAAQAASAIASVLLPGVVVYAIAALAGV